MAEYKAPATRKAIKSKVKALLMDWVNENLDDSGDTNTLWDDADDAAARTYEEVIEDGKGPAAAMKAAKERFWDELRFGVDSQIIGICEELGK